MQRLRNLAVLGLVAAVALGAPPARAAPCVSATNIEAIVDDSGSMAASDPNRLRVQALDLLIDALNPATTLGVVEFGSGDVAATPPVPAAAPVFDPAPVGTGAPAMQLALATAIQADNGATDYNAAFNTARAANPGAQARIFLTDGGHDIGYYLNAHLNPIPPQTPTYVIGFGIGVSAPDDQARLQRIAAGTGGSYFRLPDSRSLPAVMDQIEAMLTCQSRPKAFTDSLAAGKTKSHSVSIAAGARSALVALTWANPADRFTISGIKILRGGKIVAIAAPPRPLKVRRSSGATFVLAKITNLVRGQLRFTVRAAAIGPGRQRARLTTQVSQARR